AYIRESTAALEAAEDGRFHRTFLEGGMHGAFAAGARKINESRDAMRLATEEVEAARTARQSLADEMETAVLSASEQVATAATEIGATASGLASFASNAADESGRATQTVSALDAASDEIKQAVRLVTLVAAQTRLLALNATIEAARAGEAGKGFAVVASEVKDLSQGTARATEDISRRVEAIQTDTANAVLAIAEASAVIAQMNEFQTTISSAVEEQTMTTSAMNASVDQAAEGSAQIAENITAVANVARSTTQSVLESQQAVAKLSEISDELQVLVGRFRFD
ncbi:MAG TPA: methyl-accepting chemotaxis protein, partial [Kineosporiaceae bacterium]|nr:methyl-accepting chemotaxis protein [Kineosporiaceae bacterium]